MEQIVVTLLGITLTLKIPVGSADRYQQAIAHLESLLTQIQTTNQGILKDQILLMACLKLSNDFLNSQSNGGPFQGVSYGAVQKELNHISEQLNHCIDALKADNDH